MPREAIGTKKAAKTGTSLPPPTLYTVDEDGTLEVGFHPGQSQAWDSERRFVFIFAGTQGGKTAFLPWWLHREVERTARSGEDNDYLAVTSSFDLFKLKFLPEMKRVFCDVLNIGRYWGTDRVIELACLDPANPKYRQFLAVRASDHMWGRIILRSAQSETGLESATAKAAILDECGQDAFAIQDWEAVVRRVSIGVGRGGGRILGATTIYNLGWIYNHVYIPFTNGNPDFDIIQFPSYMNPAFPREEYERAKRSMPAWRFAMFYKGEFERPAGAIYGDFKELIMLVDRFPIPSSWEHVVGVDFGGANTATIWLAHNPDDDRWYAFRETLSGHRATADHCQEQSRYALGISDLSAIGGAKSENQQRDDWYEEGFMVEEPIISGLEPGISRVIELIKTDRLRVFRDLEGLRNEIRTYRRKLGPEGNPLEQIINKNRFHRLDALRYAATHILDEGNLDMMTYASYIAQRRNGR